jgi:5-methylcytosine-specific restriction protein A
MCSSLIGGADRFCEKHAKQNGRKYYSTVFKGRKEEKADPFYSSKKWQALRLAKVRANPICEHCKHRLTREVHHIKPVKEFPHLKLNYDNVQSLCRPCHWKLTQQEAKERKERMENRALWLPTVRGKHFLSDVSVVYHPPFLRDDYILDAMKQVGLDGAAIISLPRITEAMQARDAYSLTLAGHIRSKAILMLTDEYYLCKVAILAAVMDGDTRREYAAAGANVYVINYDKEELRSSNSMEMLGQDRWQDVWDWFDTYKREPCDKLVDARVSGFGLRFNAQEAACEI